MTGWPTKVDNRLVTHAIDQHMLAAFERQTASAVRDFQAHQLRTLLRHAARHSHWWRERLPFFATGEKATLHDMPLLTRDDYRASIAAAGGPLPLPDGHGAATSNATSGSSGVPVKFYVSGLVARMNAAHYHRDRTRHRIDTTKSFARIALAVDPHDGEHVRVPGNPLFGRNEELLRRSKQFSVEAHARWLSHAKPAYLYASTSILEGIIDTYEQGITAVPSRPVEALLSFAETVTPQFRAQARRVLGARVLDRYSCEEVGPLAFQCPVSEEHYHIAASNAVVEVLDAAGAPSAPGEIGRVIVTSLHNLASPVVRYELGDLAAREPRCVCGYDGPVLVRLLGRKRFLIRLPSGERQHVLVNAKHWLSVAPVREARIVQVSEDVIHAECVPDRPLTPEEHESILSMLRREISPALTYRILEQEYIDWGPTYKRQDVVSLI